MKRILMLLVLLMALVACQSSPSAETPAPQVQVANQNEVPPQVQSANQNEVPPQVDSSAVTLPGEIGNVVEQPLGRQRTSSFTWMDIQMVNVLDEQVFKISDYRGKVTLVLLMSVACADCPAQQQEVQAFASALDSGENLEVISIDVDAAETADMLREFAVQFGFDWKHALGPADWVSQVVAAYGVDFADPASMPVLVIDQQADVTLLPLGFKSKEELLDAVQPLLAGQ